MAKQLTVNIDQIRKYERDLKKYVGRAFPFATKFTINKAAFDARQNWQDEISSKMIERNKWTRNSIRVKAARGLNVDSQEATVGSLQAYMATQESGGVVSSSGKHGVRLTTSYASGEGESAKPRKKLAKGANAMRKIQLSKSTRKGGSRAQRNFIAVKQAAKTGRRFVFMDLGRKKGIFRVVGGKRNPKVKMLHDMSKKSYAIKPRPTMEPAIEKTNKKMPEIYRQELINQLRRNGLFAG